MQVKAQNLHKRIEQRLGNRRHFALHGPSVHFQIRQIEPAMEAIEQGQRARYYGLPIVGSQGFKFDKDHHLNQRVDPDRIDRECGPEDEAVLRAWLQVREVAGQIEASVDPAPTPVECACREAARGASIISNRYKASALP